MYALAILAFFGAWLIWEFKSVMKMALGDDAPEPLDFDDEELKPCA